jgi:sugar (pentulose or hexulose) kinase
MARMAKDIFVGIDAGTTGSKVALFDARGRNLAPAIGVSLHLSASRLGRTGRRGSLENLPSKPCRSRGCHRCGRHYRSVGFSSQRGSSFYLMSEHPLAPAVL